MASREVIEKLSHYSRKSSISKSNEKAVNVSTILFGEITPHSNTDNQLSYNESIYRYNKRLSIEIQYLKNEIKKHIQKQSAKRLSYNTDSSDNVEKELLEAMSQVPEYIYKLTCLPHILVTDRLESTIESSKATLESLRRNETVLRTALEKEQKSYEQATTLSTLLESQVGIINNKKTEPAERLIQSVVESQEQVEERSKYLKIQLKSLLETQVADVLYQKTPGEVGQDSESLQRNLVNTFENLMNEMFDPDSATDGYVTLSDPDSVVARFLLQGDLITRKEDDSSQVRLRDFGKS